MLTAKKTAKTAFALSLAATMVAPAGVSVAAASKDDADVVVPEPLKVYDFENGLQELYDTDDNFKITKSKEVYFQKTAEEVGTSEKVDANGLVYVGSGSETRYHKGTISNQPTTAYDEEKGTVLKIGKSQVIPAVYKTQSAGLADAAGTEALDKEVGVTTAAVQEEYVANSEIVISNPFGSDELRAELTERTEFDVPNYDGDYNVWKRYRGSRYQPVWKKGVTISYWINVPSNEAGEYNPSSVLRWELDDQRYYQVDDYAKHLGCKFFDIEKTAQYMNYQAEDYEVAAKNESKVIYGSEYYFKYAQYKTDAAGNTVTDASGAPVAETYRGAEGFDGPVYDVRFFEDTEGYEKSWYYMYSPYFIRGYVRKADGTYEAQLSQLHGGTTNYYSQYATLDPEQGSHVRQGLNDGELQIDVDNSIFWVPDNNLAIQDNPNDSSTYGVKQGLHNADVFFMNSWQEGSKTDAAGNGTYQSARAVAISPVSSIKDYDEEEGEYTGVKNGNLDKWHQVTITLQNDWIEFYVDGIKADVDNHYSSRGLVSLDTKESFKRINKGTGLRYGYGAEKGAINFAYGNYVARLLMDWITDDEATLHIGGAGQYATQYAQATTSNEFSLDDLKFYGELLTEDQIIAAYTAEAEAMNAVPTAEEATTADMTVTDASVFAAEFAKKNTTTVGQDTINGKTVNVVKVDGNTSLSKTTGAAMVNPFAGKKLSGATIGYWVKQDETQRSAAVSFIDTEKYVYNPKGEGEIAGSVLTIYNDGIANFKEGFTNASFANSHLKNTFITGPDATGSAVLLANADKWNYVTVTMTNAGIKYYVNGEPVENQNEYPTGVRFHDGYFQRLADEADPITKFGAFGGTDNQCATMLMEFLTYEDTALYLNYLPDDGGMAFKKTAGASFAAIKTVDAALSAEEVKALYESSLDLGASVVKGDVDGNGKIELADAQVALKIALKIVGDATADQIAAGDIDVNGKVELADARAILKEALKITTNFQ